jgi:hypothetical protein
MNFAWVDVAEPIVAGLAGILGICLTEEMLGVLRRSGLCPERWALERTRSDRSLRREERAARDRSGLRQPVPEVGE